MSAKTLVTLDDYVKTYHRGPQLYSGYLAVQDLTERGYTIKKAARSAKVNENTAASWFGKKHKKVPEVVKAVRRLEKNGMLPLTLASPQLLEPNKLAAYIYWTGYFGHSKETHGYTGAICGLNESVLDQLGAEFKNRLGINSQRRSVHPGNVASWQLEFEKGFAHYARLLECLGLQTGARNGTKRGDSGDFVYLQLPRYITEMMDRAEAGQENPIENSVLNDFVAVMLKTQTRDPRGQKIEIRLKDCSSSEDRERYIDSVKRLLELVHPGLKDNIFPLRCDNEKKGPKTYYSAELHFNGLSTP